MLTEIETRDQEILVLRAEIADLKKMRSQSWEERGWSVLAFISENKRTIAIIALAIGWVANRYFPSVPPITQDEVQQVAKEIVKEHNTDVDKKVEKAVESRPVPPPVIQVIPAGVVKTTYPTEEKKK